MTLKSRFHGSPPPFLRCFTWLLPLEFLWVLLVNQMEEGESEGGRKEGLAGPEGSYSPCLNLDVSLFFCFTRLLCLCFKHILTHSLSLSICRLVLQRVWSAIEPCKSSYSWRRHCCYCCWARQLLWKRYFYMVNSFYLSSSRLK